MSRLRIICCVLALSVILGPSATVAQQAELSPEQQEHLVRLIEDGKQAYDRGEFAKSLQHFRAAYDLYQHPDIIYRIALCHERLGEDEQAVRYYRQFLAEAPNAPERPRIEKTIEVIEARVAKSEIRVTSEPDGAAVYIDDEANGVAGYTPTALVVKPGNYKLIVRKDGFEPVRELVTVKPGQSVQMRYQLAGTTTAPTDVTAKPPRPRHGGPSVQFLALTAVGVASGVTAIIFFNKQSATSEEIAEIEALESRQGIDRDKYDATRNRRNVELGIAVSAAALSTFSFIWAYGTWVNDRNAARRQAAGLTLGWSDGPVVGYGARF